MRRGLVPLPRIAALSVVITLFAAPLASAQSREAVSPIAAPANTALLSPAAFARLVQPLRADVAPVPARADSPRTSLLRQGAATMAREAKPAFTNAPQQKSWVSRHKVATGIYIGLGVFIAALFINCAADPHGCDY